MSKLCVVDDDAEVLAQLGRMLRASGLKVDLLDRLNRAPELLRTRRYDLIMLDLGPSDLEGIRVLRALRTNDPQAQVMVVSANDNSANRVRFLNFGACDFLGKPFETAELIARVRARLRSWGGDPLGFMRAGTARLDLIQHRMVLCDRSIPLSTREFLLLEYLMQRSGQACSRKELMSAVWGYDFDADPNVVDVYVCRLRAKIPRGLIETVRRVGYTYAPA